MTDTMTKTPTPTAEERQLEQARSAYETAKAALHDERGQPLYVPDEYQRRLDAARADLDKIVDATIASADAQVAQVEREISTISTDTAAVLSDAELKRAGDRAPFAREDFDELPPAELAARCKAALAGGDKVEMFLAERYSRRRHDREMAGLVFDEHGRATGRLSEGITELRPLADALAAKLIDPKGDKAKLEARKAAAQLLDYRARQTRATYDGSREAAQRAMRMAF